MPRMRYDRLAAGRYYKPHGVFKAQKMAADIILPPGVEKAVEHVGHAVGDALFYEAHGEMRSSYGGARVLCLKLIEIYHDAVPGQKVDHFPVALVSVLNHPAEHRREPVRVRIEVVGEDVHLLVIPAAGEFHAGHDLHAVLLPGLLRSLHAVYAVVIRDGDSPQSELLCVSDGVLRRFRAVGYIRMRMQVYLSHALITLIILSASA